MEHYPCGGKKLGNKPEALHGMTIDNQERRCLLQSFEKIDEVYCSLNSHDPHFPSPLFRVHLHGGILLRESLLDPKRIFLEGSPESLLGAQPQLFQQTVHRGIAQKDAKTPVNSFFQHATCSRRESKLKLTRNIRRNGLIQVFQFHGTQHRTTVGPTTGLQSTPANPSIFGQPAKNRAHHLQKNLGQFRRRLTTFNHRNAAPPQVRQLVQLEIPHHLTKIHYIIRSLVTNISPPKIGLLMLVVLQPQRFIKIACRRHRLSHIVIIGELSRNIRRSWCRIFYDGYHRRVSSSSPAYTAGKRFSRHFPD